MSGDSFLNALRTPYRIGAALSGLDPLRSWSGIRGLSTFTRTLREYRRRSNPSFKLRLANLHPILTDFHQGAGSAQGHYFHQDLWAARKIYLHRPARHVDVGSRIDGFIAHLLVFMPVEVLDIRPLETDVTGLRFVQGDGTSLASFPDNSVESLSTLHAVEHFGLGRYGDPVDPDACFVAMDRLGKILRPGGRLYFAVPIGRERLEFNAHRVFAPATILRSFTSLRLVSFSAVDDDGALKTDRKPHEFAAARFACGLFEFTK